MTCWLNVVLHMTENDYFPAFDGFDDDLIFWCRPEWCYQLRYLQYIVCYCEANEGGGIEREFCCN